VAVNSAVDDAAMPSAGRSLGLARELTERRAGLAAVSGRICGSRSLQQAVAGRSYWHPNGFIKLVIEERAGWGQLRLHVWPSAQADDDVHDHAWQYESVVVDGDVREVRYREAAGDDVGDEMWRHSYGMTGHRRFTLREVRYREAAGDDVGDEMWRHSYGMTGHRRFTLRDPVPVRIVMEASPHDFHTGDRSGGAPGHVHRFFAVTAPTVTLLRVGPILMPFSHVYRTEAAPQPALVPRPTSRADVAEWVDHVRGIATASLS
jgi:hypothetical protein